jgi:hypothetical protein
MPFRKLDDKGRYTKFPGMTVVSPIREEDMPFWVQIFNSIASYDEALDYFSPLPCTSYHMTTTNLYTQQEDGGDDWEKFIEGVSPGCQALHKLLTENSFSPRLVFKAVITRGIIQLVVTLPPAQSAKIYDIAKKAEVHEGVPSFFHITLAYQYKEIPPKFEEEMNAQLLGRLNSILRVRKVVKLDPPTLCTFDYMTAFTPWDGKASSLIARAAPKQTFFSDKKAPDGGAGKDSSCSYPTIKT